MRGRDQCSGCLADCGVCCTRLQNPETLIANCTCTIARTCGVGGLKCSFPTSLSPATDCMCVPAPDDQRSTKKRLIGDRDKRRIRILGATGNAPIHSATCSCHRRQRHATPHADRRRGSQKTLELLKLGRPAAGASGETQQSNCLTGKEDPSRQYPRVCGFVE